MFWTMLTFYNLVMITVTICISIFAYWYMQKRILYVIWLKNKIISQPDSVTSFLDLVDGHNLPPSVHLQLIINWLDKFKSKYTDQQKDRINKAYDRLVALENTRCKIDLQLRYHNMDLNMIKQFLYNKGIGTVSVGHQISQPEKMKPTPQKHVTYYNILYTRIKIRPSIGDAFSLLISRIFYFLNI